MISYTYYLQLCMRFQLLFKTLYSTGIYNEIMSFRGKILFIYIPRITVNEQNC